MAILKSFDPANYETKTITLSVSAGSSYTLGDAYSGGGRVVDLWVAEGFVSSAGEKDVDYVLTGIDSRLSTDYGTTYYTVFKSVTITGTVTITYRRYGTYVDAGQINQHETRLGSHDTRLTSVESVNATQNGRLAAIETKNGEQDSNISSLEDGLADEITARSAADTALQGNIDTHANNTTNAHGATSAATANKGMIRDENARVQIVAGAANLDAVNKAQMDAAISAAVVAAGSGDMAGPSSSNASGIPMFSGTTGKILMDSGFVLGETPFTTISSGDCLAQILSAFSGVPTSSRKIKWFLVSSGLTNNPTGSLIFFMQARGCSTTIEVMALQGSGPTEYTNNYSSGAWLGWAINRDSTGYIARANSLSLLTVTSGSLQTAISTWLTLFGATSIKFSGLTSGITGYPPNAGAWVNYELNCATNQGITYFTLIARDLWTNASWITSNTGTAIASWTPTWTQLTDANGYALKAVASRHTVTASRAAATTYTNSSGESMFVNIVVGQPANGTAGSQASLQVGTVNVSVIVFSAQVYQQHSTLTAVVPAGSTYYLVLGTGLYISSWHETY